jgi:hypothetical protein
MNDSGGHSSYTRDEKIIVLIGEFKPKILNKQIDAKN